MSKYTEYRTIAEKKAVIFEENFGDTDRKVAIAYDLYVNRLDIQISGNYGLGDGVVTLSGETGEVLFKALKQLYE
jgi:hypothetical protein